MKKKLFAGAAAAALLLQPIPVVMAQSTTTSPPAAQEEPAQQDQMQQNQMQQNESTPGEAPATGDMPTGTQAQDQMQDQTQNPLMQMTAGDLIGKTVVNEAGEEVGEIEDIVIGTTDKEVQAIVAVGGFLGIGDKSIALSFDELEPGQEDNVLLTSGATVEELKQRPAYDEASGDFESYPPERTPAESAM